jgi:iron complex transport system substrate-binding protein
VTYRRAARLRADALRICTRSLVLIVASALLPVAAIQAGTGPQRVVSMNVCTDQLVMSLLPRRRIASLSYIAADARTSGIADLVDGIPLNHGMTEEILALRPDLVVTGAFGFRPTVTLLRRLGYEVLELPMADTLSDIERNLRTLGAALGADDRAAELIAAFADRTQQLSVEDKRGRPLFVNLDANGWTTGQTGLLADIVHRAGLSTPGDRLGFAASARVNLEALLLLHPALIDLGYAWDDPPALASEQRRHPVVRAVMRDAAPVDIPDSAWLCGTPHSLDALAALRAARDELLRTGAAAHP